MAFLLKRLREQTTHSAVLLAVILLLAARAAGVDLVGLTSGAADLLTAFGLASAAAKALLPEAPVAPPVISDAAQKGLERLGDALEPPRGDGR